MHASLLAKSLRRASVTLALPVVAIVGLSGCHAMNGATRELEGFVAIYGDTLLLFPTVESMEDVDFDACANVAADDSLLERASKIEGKHVKVTVEDLGWPFMVIDGSWTVWQARGQRVQPWCSQPPLYWAKKLTVMDPPQG